MLRDGVRLFGTDGVRGVANLELTADFALALGRAAGSGRSGGSAVIGRDTRLSGDMLSMAVQAGFHSVGVDTVDVGVLPTGGISRLTADVGADLGVVVSASHNPAEDNGIKFFSRAGAKLSDADEDQIEAVLRNENQRQAAMGPAIGTRRPMADPVNRYVSLLKQDVPYSFSGISVVLDCANGASYQAAPELFRRLRADVSAVGIVPDGMNINAGCGATHPEFVASLSQDRIGLSFDGDADRLIAVDESGTILDGDVVIAILAKHWKSQGKLKRNTVVVTVMSNLGFHRAMRDAGIEVVTTQVGDRYVAEQMWKHKAILGGEQSGHVIFADRARTGDGLLTAVRLLEVVAATGKPLSDLASEAMTSYPQVLKNIRVVDKDRLAVAAAVWKQVAEVERLLGDDGRVLVRPSGTEPLVRVMVEATDSDLARRYTDRLIEVIGIELGKE